MRTVPVLSTILVVVLAVSHAIAQDLPDGNQDSAALFVKTCSQCHQPDPSWPGSRPIEEWRKRVATMQERAAGTEKRFSDDVAARIVQYLGTPDPTAVEGSSDGGPAPEPEAKHHGGKAGQVGGILGILTGALLAGMIGAGVFRKRLGRRFHKLHRAGAGLLITALTVHAVILFLYEGPPRSVWHACGTLALVCVVLTGCVGLRRRRFGKRFLRLHQIGAFAALLFGILHRALD